MFLLATQSQKEKVEGIIGNIIEVQICSFKNYTPVKFNLSQTGKKVNKKF